MVYVKIGENQYPATITGRLSDEDWNNRASKAIKLEIPYSIALTTFVDDVEWSIVQDIEDLEEVIDEEGNPVHRSITRTESYDNSEYSIAGDIIDHRNGTVTVKMGQPTAEELLTMIMEGIAE